MEIRPAAAEDAGALAALNGQLGYPCSPAELLARLTQMQRPTDHEVLVALVDAAPVGWIHVFRNVTLETGSAAVIGGLVVDAARRGSGVGTALLAAAEEWAKRRGERTIRVRSQAIRDRAHRFYEERGYSRTKQQVVFDKLLG